MGICLTTICCQFCYFVLKNVNCLIKPLPLYIYSVNATALVCMTSSVLTPDLYDGVSVTFDGTSRDIPTASFEYTENPVINEVSPQKSYIA